MAHIYRNIFIHGLTDLLGDRSTNIKTRSGKTLIPSKAMFYDSLEVGTKQEMHADVLLKATTYANFASKQEAYSHKARENQATVYSLALTDWFGAPKVLQINFNAWTGEPGQTIRVKARDNVKVAGVSIVIRDAEGNLLEAGEAVPSETGGAWWDYTTKSCAVMVPFPTLEATARDLAGNHDCFTIT